MVRAGFGWGVVVCWDFGGLENLLMSEWKREGLGVASVLVVFEGKVVVAVVVMVRFACQKVGD